MTRDELLAKLDRFGKGESVPAPNWLARLAVDQIRADAERIAELREFRDVLAGIECSASTQTGFRCPGSPLCPSCRARTHKAKENV